MDVRDLKSGVEALRSRLSTFAGSYTVPLGKLAFKFDMPLPIQIPYNLSDDEFVTRLPEIRKALIFFHEFVHYIQAWSTTAGINEFLCVMGRYNQLAAICEETQYRLPLAAYGRDLLRDDSKRNPDQTLFLERYFGYLYKVLTHQWLQGTMPYAPRIHFPDCTFITPEVVFLDEELDTLFGVAGRKYPVFNIPLLGSTEQVDAAPVGQIETKWSPIGSLHLMECFAQSVEFEHLMWFNERYASRVMGQWIFDDDALNYNLPIRLAMLMPNGIDVDNMPYFWAHVRVFIDLALMYSDILQLGLPIRRIGEFLDPVYRQKVHPGITYYDILRAFSRVRPLRDHEQDVLRLHHDLSQVLGMPPLDDMLKRLSAIVDAYVEYLERENVGFAKIFSSASRLLHWKMRDPLLFINGLIHSNNVDSLFSAMRNNFSIAVPSGFAESEAFTSSYLYECLLDLDDQALRRRRLECPSVRDHKCCIYGRGSPRACAGDGGGDFEKHCFLGAHAWRWLTRQKGGDNDS